MNLKHLIICGGLLVAATSCGTQHTVLPYFSDIVEVKEGLLPQQEFLPKIQADDELFISISSKIPEATAAYNLPFSNPATRDQLTLSSAPRTQTYIVDKEGNITLPIIGTVHVAGMNVEQLKELITKKVSSDVIDPIVSVQLVNFTVTIGGEVRNPQNIRVNRNRITLLEALATAGDMTEYGERGNVMVIREIDGKRTFAHIDLNKSDFLSSSYYYLQPNDYVYVSPNAILQENSKYSTNKAYNLQLTSTIVSAASVIASLIIALTVK